MTKSAIRDVELFGETAPRADCVAVEEPLEIRVGRLPISVLMRTPGDDDELAAGLLLTEGVVERPEQILEIQPCREGPTVQAGNVVVAMLSDSVRIDADRFRRLSIGGAGCGMCGKTAIQQIRVRGRPLGDGPRVSREVLLNMPGVMRGGQAVFDRTGGLHAAALFDPPGEPCCVREDIGRHNAVDKVVGWAIHEQRIPLSDGVLLVSGRAGFEIVQKAYVAGITVLASISAPSSLAIELARETGMTLIGFLRSGSYNVYTSPERVIS